MTSKQRRKQNRINAQKSTGPKTDEGKAVARQNALKHGLTAAILSLPNESPLQIQVHADAFHDALQPQSHDEEILVDQIVLSTLRLERFAKAETAILTDQVLHAEIQWDVTQQNRVLDLSRMMRIDPAKATIELRSFAAGANWLLDRWKDLGRAVAAAKCIDMLETKKDLLRLLGFNPEDLKNEPIAAYELMLRMCCCLDTYKEWPLYVDYLREQAPPQWHAEGLPRDYPVAESLPIFYARLDAEIASAQALVDVLTPLAVASRACAADRALVPADTSQNRLFLRYRNSAEMTFNRTIKTLEKLQSDREKLAKAEAENDDPRNGPNLRGQAGEKRVLSGGCVTVNGTIYRTVDSGDGKIVLVPASPPVDPMDSPVSATPETVT